MKCTNCKYFHRDFLFGGGGWCEGDPTEIRRIKEIFAVLDTPCDIIDAEKDKTTIKPERKKGHWIFVHPLQEDDQGGYMCSVCQNGDWNIKPTDKYCKFCGAEMEGEEHD